MEQGKQNGEKGTPCCTKASLVVSMRAVGIADLQCMFEALHGGLTLHTMLISRDDCGQPRGLRPTQGRAEALEHRG